MNVQKIIEIARGYIGETEKPNNSGFLDAEFEQRMADVGWLKGQAWCAYEAELIWKEANPDLVKVFSTLFSGSSLATYNNFKAAGWPIGMEPKNGAIAIFKHGNGPSGHTTIVVDEVLDDEGRFGTVEGNTNDKGGRDGYITAEKRRKLHAPFTLTGLNLVGFIYAEPPASITNKVA